MRSLITASLITACLGSLTQAADTDAPTLVGVAVVDITPDYPIRLNGYGGRKTESEGVSSRLKARALAIGESPVVLVSVDNCGVPVRISDEVAARLKSKSSLPRERLAVCSTHTHCAPCLSNGIPFIFGAPLPNDQQAHVERYTRELTDALEKVAAEALANRKPSRLAWARGKVAFATNRRMLKDGKWTGFGANPNGPVDHSLPVLRINDPDGKLRAVLVGYACHCTTLTGEFNQISAEWAGYAADEIEQKHPGAVALMIIGCGADADPQPRRTLEATQAHGKSISQETERLIGGTMTPLPGAIAAKYQTIELPFAMPPTREQLVERSQKPGAEGYFARTMVERLDRGESLQRTLTYPIQTWSFGDALGMVFLGGEVVVDYALRLQRECDADRLWVVAYSNDVPCYIASKRVIAEGGYETDGSMIYYGRPNHFEPAVEDLIVDTVHNLLPTPFNKR